MTNLYRKATVLVLLAALLLGSCDHAAECLSDIFPNLPTLPLADGTMHQPYTQLIAATIDNDEDSEYYIEHIEVEGNFPEGISYEATGMQLTLSGTPANAGEYDFDIKITVRPYNYPEGEGDGMCGNIATTSYKIKVNWAN